MRLDLLLAAGAAVLSVAAWLTVQWCTAWHLTAVATAGALLLIGILLHRLERERTV